VTSTLHPVEPAVAGFLDLATRGGAPAVVTPDGTLSYADLAALVARDGDRLGATRRLVLVEGRNDVPTLTAYLAALSRGHVVLLTPPGEPARAQEARWDPDLVVGEEWREVRPGSAHDLHPELALLMSTSGSTGAPKLVRLSRGNLEANAASIADYLRLGPGERAITSLPMHYCYGLSVVHSHLAAGAALVLTGLSVVDDCFWDLAARAEVTSMAAVPYTFELLERSGRTQLGLAGLRYVTQAGGRMNPERLAQWRERGRNQGWDLVVMYGQTEATARMAWLPPALAADHPDAVGVPVPGGELRLEPVPEPTEPGVGELVYRGDNVMMGYALEAADLARGPELTELRTGDLARCVDGVYQIVGRRGRQVKLFGLRLDLDHLEDRVPGAQCVVVDDTLHAFTTRVREVDRLRERLRRASGLPLSAVCVSAVADVPQTPSGKPDRMALQRHARARRAVVGASVRDEYAVVLGRPDATVRDSFVSLGGDSLSYVELATRLAERLGRLPTGWPTMPIAELEGGRRRAGSWLETGIVLRAAAILAIVGSHTDLWNVMGGAHLLLVVAGFGLARFQLSADTRRERVRLGAASLLLLWLPAAAWLGTVALLTGGYRPATVFLLNGLLGSDTWTDQWQLWFLEALVWTVAGLLALTGVPAFDRVERRAPFATALVVVLAAMAARFAWVGLTAGPTERYTVGVVAWWVLLGWLAARADSRGRRLLVVGLAAAGTFGFFGDPVREALVVGGVAALVLLPSVPVPRLLVRPVSLLASASLFVYLTHWQVYPPLEERSGLLALAVSLAVGVTVWWLARPALRRVRALVVGRANSAVPSGC
jgi:acyl-coenzyme A synthetase/AMP-(fatty) acid ligase